MYSITKFIRYTNFQTSRRIKTTKIFYQTKKSEHEKYIINKTYRYY